MSRRTFWGEIIFEETITFFSFSQIEWKNFRFLAILVRRGSQNCVPHVQRTILRKNISFEKITIFYHVRTLSKLNSKLAGLSNWVSVGSSRNYYRLQTLEAEMVCTIVWHPLSTFIYLRSNSWYQNGLSIYHRVNTGFILIAIAIRRPENFFKIFFWRNSVCLAWMIKIKIVARISNKLNSIGVYASMSHHFLW